MRETIKEYFTFSKKERTGILVLLSAIIIIAVAPVFYKSKNVGFGDSSALREFKDQIAVLDASGNNGNGIDSISYPGFNKFRNGYLSNYENSGKYPNDRKYQDNEKFQDNEKYMGYEPNAKNNRYRDKRYNGASNDLHKKKVVMYDFDPNTIPASGWIQLGVSERTALTIDKYRSKGGKFRKADDILRIYGLSEEDKQRLLPFVKITPGDTSKRTNAATSFDNPLINHDLLTKVHDQQRGQQFKRKIPEIIDINTADTSGWSSLPGIGPVLSQRIIKYRDRLGGFYSVEQVAEVYGLQDSVYKKIRPFLTRVAAVRKINVNMVTPDILEQHPYLKRQLARAIIDYRSQHGVFKEISELKQVVSITPELFDRISHYIGL